MELGADFDDFVAQASKALLRTAYLLTFDHGHAEDIVQECLLRVGSHWSAAKETPFPYARRVLVNLAHDRRRRAVRRPTETALAVADEESWSRNDGEEADRSLPAALGPELARLPERWRSVLVLRLWEDLTVSETAEVLKLPEGTVKSDMSRALAQLRAVLETTQEVM